MASYMYIYVYKCVHICGAERKKDMEGKRVIEEKGMYIE